MRVWCARIGTEPKTRPTGGIGAGTVERHHELLRQSLHRIKEQTKEEGLVATDGDILSEAVMVKNILLNTYGHSPFEALTGRRPNVLKDFETVGTTEAEERDDHPKSVAHGVNRLREIACQAIVEGTSKDRITRALKSKARVAG